MYMTIELNSQCANKAAFLTAYRPGGIVYRDVFLFYPMLHDNRMQLYFVYPQGLQKITGKTLACDIDNFYCIIDTYYYTYYTGVMRIR